MTSTKTMKPILPKSSLSATTGSPFHSFVGPGTTVILVTQQQGPNVQPTLQLPQGQLFLPISSSSFVRPFLAPKIPTARGANKTSGKVSSKKKTEKVTKNKTVSDNQKQNKSIKVKRKPKCLIKPSYSTAVKPILPKGQNTPEIPVFLTSTTPLTITSCLNGGSPLASILRPVIVASNVTQSIDTKQTILRQVDNNDISKRQVLNIEKSNILKSKRSKMCTNKSNKPILNKSSKRNVANTYSPYTVSYNGSEKNDINIVYRDHSSRQNSKVESHLQNNEILKSSSPKILCLETDSNQNIDHKIPHWQPPPPYPEQLNRNIEDIQINSNPDTTPRMYENNEFDKSTYFYVQPESDKSEIIDPLLQNSVKSLISTSNSTLTNPDSQCYAIDSDNTFKQHKSQDSDEIIATSKEMALDFPIEKMLGESSQSSLSYTSTFCEAVNVSSSYTTSTPLSYSSPPLRMHTPPAYTRLSSSPLGVVGTYSSPSPLPLPSYSNTSPLIEPSTVSQTYSSITNTNNSSLNQLTSYSEKHKHTDSVNDVEQSTDASYSASTYKSSLPYSDALFYQDPLVDDSNKTDSTSPSQYLTTYKPHHTSYPPLPSSSSNSYYINEITNHIYTDNYQGSYKEILTNTMTFSSQEIDKSTFFPSVRSPSPPSYHAHFQSSCYNPNVVSQQNILPPDNHSPLPSFRKCTSNYSITCNSSNELDQDQLPLYPSSPAVSLCNTQPHLPLPPPQPPPPQYSSTPHRNTSDILYDNYYFAESFSNAEDCTVMAQDNDTFSESQNSFHNIISEPSSLHSHSLSTMGYHTAPVSTNNTDNNENKFYDYENFPTNIPTEYYSNSLSSTPAQMPSHNDNQIESFFDTNKISSIESSYQHRKYKSSGRESPDSESMGDESTSINESLKVLLYIPEEEQNKVYQERKEKALSLLNQAELQTKRDSTLKEKFWIEEDEPLADGIINGDKNTMNATETEKANSDSNNSTPSSFITSLLKKKTSQSLLCQVCGQMLKSANSLKSHLASHQSLRPHSCPYCSKRFTCKSTLKNHQRIHTGEMPFACNICSMTFRTRSSLERHKVLHSDLRPFQCSVCHKSFKTKLVLQYHVTTHIVGLFPCSICGKTFPRKKSLLIHKASHSASARMFQCPHCSKAYQFRSLLNNHLQLHLNIQKYRCHVCSQGFVWRSSLTAHLRTHKKRWNCDTCSRSFASEKGFESHNCHHGVRKNKKQI